MEYDDSFNNKAAAIWTLFISIHLNLYTLLRYCVGPLQELHSSKKVLKTLTWWLYICRLHIHDIRDIPKMLFRIEIGYCGGHCHVQETGLRWFKLCDLVFHPPGRSHQKVHCSVDMIATILRQTVALKWCSVDTKGSKVQRKPPQHYITAIKGA